jgi:hypothetical protein
LTHDTDRLAAFYREVFDAEIGSHLEEFVWAVRDPDWHPPHPLG